MNQITVVNPDKSITAHRQMSLQVAGQVANNAASNHIFNEYISRKAANTVRTQGNALAVFVAYLEAAGVMLPCDDLQHDPECWRGMTWGIVEGFVKWQLSQGYSIGSVNGRLSVVKIYSGLAQKASVISDTDYRMIQTVKGYAGQEGKRIDEKRDVTRIGHKKAEKVRLTVVQAKNLSDSLIHGDTPQGRRDTLILCLLLEHGLRVGEVAGLQVSDFDLAAGELRFYRPKVNISQTHKLTAKTLRAAIAYFQHDAPTSGRVILGSTKGGALTAEPMSTRALTKRVGYLGNKIAGVVGLSAHDLRHHWATDAAKNDTPLFALQEAGGWKSLDMPRRYVDAAAIANEGVRLSA